MKMNSELEKKLWAAADALRGNISSEQYMNIVIGIMFLKHMSDKYVKGIEKLKKDKPEKFRLYLENKDFLATEYNISFIIPEDALWENVAKFVGTEEIGARLDNAFLLIEEKNDELRGLFEKKYNQDKVDQRKLGMVVSEFSNLYTDEMGEDVFGRTYEYFIGKFMSKQGQKGGEFYTPDCLVDLMVKIINPESGKLYDPTSGTGGMFVQARKNIIKNGGDVNRLVVYGQELQDETWRLSQINLLIHGFLRDNYFLGNRSADTFTNDLHKNELFDFVLANPPFNVKKWGFDELQDDLRFKELGMPPKGNANYAFLSHMIYKLNDNGIGATILANGSLSSSGKSELQIRKNMIEKGYINAIIALPDKLFYTTQIPACIWVFNKRKQAGDVLMIDASNFQGNMKSKKLRELTDEEIAKIVDVFRNHIKGETVNQPGFAKSVSKQCLVDNGYSFVPGRYVEVVEKEVDKEELKKKIVDISKEIESLFEEFEELSPKVRDAIKKALDFKDE